MGLVSKLEDENRRLHNELQQKNDENVKSDLSNSTATMSMKF